MISIVRKKGLINIEEIWFGDKNSPTKKEADIVSYNQAKEQFGYLERMSDTLISDLTSSEEEILQVIDKDYRYEIRRAKRENVLCSIWDNKISDDLIIDFVENYAEFSRVKCMPEVDVTAMTTILRKYNDEGALAISHALINDHLIVWHVYLYDDQVCRLMYSISHYRENTEIKNSIVGMANRLLHYEDMLYFKRKGCSAYDWGGVEDSEEIKHITEFKTKFGGNRCTVYYLKVGKSLKGKVALFIKKKILRR